MNNGKIIAVLNDIKAKILESPYILTDHRFNVRVEALDFAINCVESQKQGKWEDIELFHSSILFKNSEQMLSHKCSCCGRYETKLASTIESNYCPHCGAYMRGEEE